MSLSIVVPTPGQPFSTQATVVDNNFTNIAAWVSGGIPDTDLASPNNSVRRLMLQSSGLAAAPFGFGVGGTDYPIQVTIGGATFVSNFWAPDAGLSSQPADFSVAGKSRKARIRGVVCVNATTPSLNATLGLYQITGVAGASSAGITITFGAAIAGSTVSLTNPVGSSITQVETAEFSLPTAGNPCFLGVNLAGGSGSMAANSVVYFTSQLYAYNA